MNGLHIPSLHLLCVLLVVISGSAAPAIDYARYRNGKISANLPGSRDIPDDRTRVALNQIENISRREYLVVDSPVTIKNGENIISIQAPLEPGSYKLFNNLIRNGESKIAIIRDSVV
ncbi:MAG: hypothetical protein Q8N94_00660 [Methanoregula sp.]|nr:hypothetical protein [Methanoregula sp.]